MAMFLRYAVCALLVGLFPLEGLAETWVEFHAEKYDFKSRKTKKKLNFTNRSYYDADSLKRSPGGDLDVWVKEVSMNDRYYVRKGEPTSEEIVKKIHLWCGARKYEVITPDAEDADMNMMLAEDVPPGSLYDRLLQTVCVAGNKGE